MVTKHCAVQHNAKQDLSAIKLAAHDELFHLNKPVLAGVDIISLYCYLLSYEEQPDSDTWGIHFMDLQNKNLIQEYDMEKVKAIDNPFLQSRKLGKSKKT